jgi:hypothetical protein
MLLRTRNWRLTIGLQIATTRLSAKIEVLRSHRHLPVLLNRSVVEKSHQLVILSKAQSHNDIGRHLHDEEFQSISVAFGALCSALVNRNSRMSTREDGTFLLARLIDGIRLSKETQRARSRSKERHSLSLLSIKTVANELVRMLLAHVSTYLNQKDFLSFFAFVFLCACVQIRLS